MMSSHEPSAWIFVFSGFPVGFSFQKRPDPQSGSFYLGNLSHYCSSDNSSKKSPEKKPKSQIQGRQSRISGKVKRRDVEKASENSEVTCQETPTEVD